MFNIQHPTRNATIRPCRQRHGILRVRLHYVTLYEIHPLSSFRRLEPFLPFPHVYLFSTIEKLEVLLREMKFDPRTNELEKTSVTLRLALGNTHICIFRLIKRGVQKSIFRGKNSQATGAGMDIPFVALACRWHNE